jgi:isoquinoline 1-oxidoreductase beta subunit
MIEQPQLNRRQVLAGAAAGALVLGLQLTGRADAAGMTAPEAAKGTFNAWLRIAADDSVTIIVSQSEMGQGVYTALPMLVAEELECDWSKVTVEAAPPDDAYKNLYAVKDALSGSHAEELTGAKDWVVTRFARILGEQFTGGSSSVRGGYLPLRQAGASAREMLRSAAATAWNVPVEECSADNGRIVHSKSGRSTTYGALASAAALLDRPDGVPLKPKQTWRLLGKPVPRLDIVAKVTGQAQFGIDVRLPDMLFAAVQACPVFGGKLKRFDKAAVMQMPGVKQVVGLDDAVAVVADSTWRAKQALAALPVTWDEGTAAGVSSDGILADFQAGFGESGSAVYKVGDAPAAMAAAARRISAEYRVPFLAHATMEPMNCTAWVTENSAEVWVPTQAQQRAQAAAAKAAGLSQSQVRIHTTLLGGGFGRRFETDSLIQAVTVAKAVAVPVQLLWSREEDMRHDFYRPAMVGRLEAGLHSDGMPVAWTHRIVGPSIMSRVYPPVTWMGPDSTSIEGAIELPYAIPNVRVSYVVRQTPVPVGFWRSVGHSHNAFIKESFLDEVAAAGGKDPVALRRALLELLPRDRAVLERAVSAAGWEKPLPPGSGRGVALHRSFGSIVAEVAEVEVGTDGALRVHRVVCAVDCGTVINPDIVEAQMQGAIVFGLTAALYGAITIDKGRVVEGNFDAYQMLRLAETPAIEVYILPSDAPPGGVGEPAVPPIAPAVANAVFAATGKRVRSLPLMGQDLRRA